jgi:hypothetical protein
MGLEERKRLPSLVGRDANSLFEELAYREEFILCHYFAIYRLLVFVTLW